jgi:enamine deaminase RidA (YjgF/YER057c/UK114 family)
VSRHAISSGSPLEPEIGFSRAVRVGNQIHVAGTAPIAPDGGNVDPADVYAQTRRCLEIVTEALAQAGASPSDVVRTRILLTDITNWRDAARAHGEVFAEVRPASTFAEVARFIDPDWAVEVEADAVVEAEAG